MAPPPGRARSSTSGSTTSSRPRPLSRASTTSLNTPITQPVQSFRHASESSHMHNSQAFHPQPTQYTAEEMITQTRQQLTNPAHYAIDPSLQNSSAGARGTSVDHAYSGTHGDMKPMASGQFSFEAKEGQFPINFNDEQTQDDGGSGETRKKKGSASSIANDHELRKLFRENGHRDLKDVASEVLAHERGPRSEKTKQIFAMNWLNTVCMKSNSSVPRNRVFSHYATRCGTERVPPLNPASFGKLVRIIFPGIQTRRLGQRGESKYHYVDLALIDEPTGIHEDEQLQVPGDLAGMNETFITRSRPRSQLPADTAVFPPPNVALDPSPSGDSTRESKASSHLFLDPSMRKLHQDYSGPNMIRRQLKFPTQQEPPYAHNEPIELPNMTDYLPEGTDRDASGALVALYRTHCISVIDCFRFCKERMFWHHFTSFHGTLTVPVQKLLAHPKIAVWIRECDWLMYQKMVRFVSPLALQVMPPKVIDTFRSISVKLVQHISSTFQNHPHHVRDAKIGPAAIFAGLIDRLLRVNATAHAAANMLTNDANRDQMWHDWICFVKPTGVVESTLPCHGYSRTLQILLLEVGELLGPLRSISYQGMQPVFINAQADPGPNYKPLVYNELDDSSTSGVLDRWTAFLHDLPSRFPEVDARQLIWIVGEVSSACIRDITMAQALSFGSWWVTKVWVDEMLRWIAEKGGFLEAGPSSTNMRPKKRTASYAGFEDDDDTKVHGGSRPRTGVSGATDGPSLPGNFDIQNRFPHNPSTMRAQLRDETRTQNQADTSRQVLGTQTKTHLPVDRAENPSSNSQQPPEMTKDADLDHGQTHDDSGIGMDLELPQNTPIRLADYGGFVAGSVNGGSDPADVVVC